MNIKRNIHNTIKDKKYAMEIMSRIKVSVLEINIREKFHNIHKKHLYYNLLKIKIMNF